MGKSIIPPLITTATGAINKGLDFLFRQRQLEDEKQWWYEQQKYIEEHNSPAFRAMQMRQAGLNPFTEVSSVPLGNVDSSLPRISSTPTFDTNAIQNSLLVGAQMENIEQDTALKKSATGLNEEKIATETEWRSNIIQQTLNLQQEFQLGLITEDEMRLRLNEYREAINLGYNSYLIEMDLKESNRLLNESIISLNEKQGQRIDQETLNLALQHASQSLQYTLDLLYSRIEREAQLNNVDIATAFTAAQYDEFMDTQEVRIALNNVQKAFAKLAVDEATRQDKLNTITNETDRIIAQQMLEAAENGEGFDYWFLNLVQRDPGAILTSMTNILGSLAPNTNFNYSTSSIFRQNN